MSWLLLACQLDEHDPQPGRVPSVDDPVPPPSVGVLVLAGGGSEGELGDAAAWSATLYASLLRGGDVNGDGRLTVAILSTAEESDWLPEYFSWLGADAATNVRAASPGDTAAAAATVAASDAVFIKGGDQGEYYDRWNGTALDTAIVDVHTAGGGIGGTSAGAMSLAQYAFAGGADLVSADVLANSTTSYLDDASDGGSGVHDDFLGLLAHSVVDTHFTQRGRLGRLAGILARAVDEGEASDLLGIGIEERTGIVVLNGRATVLGDGSVTFLRPDPTSPPTREPAQPLVWTNLGIDRLTHGWRYDLEARAADTSAPPEEAEAVAWDGTTEATPGAWSVDGDLLAHEERFAIVVERGDEPYATHAGSDLPVLPDAVGLLDAHDSERRGANEESLFRGLHDVIGHTGFLVADAGRVERRTDVPARLRFVDNPEVPGGGMATLVVDTSRVTYRSLSPSVSLCDVGDGSLHAASLVGARLHVLYSDVGEGWEYDSAARAVVHPTE